MQTPPPIRVLVVDDAILFRRALSEALSADPEIEVVGAAANGSIALAKIPTLKPDVVTLDFEMPDMDGLQTLRRIKAEWPQIKCVMASSHTKRGADLTLDALSSGAADFVEKPAGEDARANMERLSTELIQKVKAICGRFARHRPAGGSDLKRTHSLARLTMRKELLVVGISTGGPAALSKVVPELTPALRVPVAVVQHMPEMFTRQLAERLASKSKVQVHEAEEGQALHAGNVYIAPGGRHLEVHREGTKLVARLNDGPKVKSCRPSADVLFHSAVKACGHRLLACVMTGMGDDGADGCRAVRDAGGAVIVQERGSCVVWGMPRAVVEADLADEEIELNDMADAWHRYSPV